ncbi:MAG: diguanylate cyclase [Solirubrobacteraceae bacterium]
MSYVLVADDSAVVRKVLSDRLGEQGWEVREAADGAAALELAAAEPPQTVLLDIEMPRLNGFQVLAAFKAEPSLRDVPVIFLTARDSSEQVADGLRRGAHDYLRKPFETAELVARLIVAQRTRALRDDLRARNEELQRLATTDVLTGLYNRRFMTDHLESLVSRSARHGSPLSAVLLDVDHFKALNDGHGHAAGDEALRQVAERLRGRLRREDVAGRWGGEEFLVLLPDTDGSRALLAAEALRTALAAAPLALGDEAVDVRISAGVAEWSDESADALLRRADAALYDAKDAGRDAVRLAGVA